MGGWCATEHTEQAALVEWASAAAGRYPQLYLLYAVPNGGDRHPVVAGKLVAEGVKKGVPDLELPFPCGGYHGLYVEMKRMQGGRVSNEQKAWIHVLGLLGYKVETCLGWDAARAAITRYLSAAGPLAEATADALRALRPVPKPPRRRRKRRGFSHQRRAQLP